MSETYRLQTVALVKKEKDAMVRTGKKLLVLLEPDSVDKPAFRQGALEFEGHLSTFGGFCDKNTQAKIQLVVRQMTMGMVDPDLFKTQLRVFLSLSVGIQVDFNRKPPFKAIGFDLKALKAYVKR